MQPFLLRHQTYYICFLVSHPSTSCLSIILCLYHCLLWSSCTFSKNKCKLIKVYYFKYMSTRCLWIIFFVFPDLFSCRSKNLSLWEWHVCIEIECSVGSIGQGSRLVKSHSPILDCATIICIFKSVSPAIGQWYTVLLLLLADFAT